MTWKLEIGRNSEGTQLRDRRRSAALEPITRRLPEGTDVPMSPLRRGRAGYRACRRTAVPGAAEPQGLHQSDQEVRWCPGCGDYAVLAAFQGFMPELGISGRTP